MTAGSGVARVYRDARLWRAVDVYRVVTLVYAVVLFALTQEEYLHRWGAWSVLGVMAGWTALLVVHRRFLRRPRGAVLLFADLVITVGCVLSTMYVDDPARIHAGEATLPSIWAAAPVASFAVAWGWRTGLAAAFVIGAADVVEVWPDVSRGSVDSLVQLALVGRVVGYSVELYTAGRRDLARAVAVDAAARERERLAADIHDSVLQVLAYVQRRGAEAGGEAAEIGRLAGEQEARLRAMVASERDRADRVVPAGEADVRALITSMARHEVTITGPASAVPLPADVTEAVGAAVAAALDNVDRHAGEGARAWVLVEDEGDVVTVTVRDDGVGFPAGTLDAAARAGRLGVAASIRGRIEELGGRVSVLSEPGEGTEIELRIPREVGR